jgi:sulfide:quinone oxidoreductase
MKIMYLAEDYFRKHNMRSTAHISYETPKDVMFDVPKYDKELRRIAQERAIDVNYYYNLIEIDGDNKQAVFENVETGDTKTLDYEMLHVTPPMGTIRFC